MPFHENLLPIAQENPLQSFFLPFLLIWTILFGALSLIRLFDKRINFVLALIFTLLTTVTPAFTWFATILPVYGAFASVGAFAAIFVVGLIVWIFSRGKETYYSAKYSGGPRLDKIDKLNKALKKLNEEYQKAIDKGNLAKAKEIGDQMDEIRKEIDIELKRRT